MSENGGIVDSVYSLTVFINKSPHDIVRSQTTYPERDFTVLQSYKVGGKSLTWGVCPAMLRILHFLSADADQVFPLNVDKDTNLKTKKLKIFYGEQSSPRYCWLKSESNLDYFSNITIFWPDFTAAGF
jgi:hypothetical protein